MEMIIVIGMVDMEIDKLADEVADMVADTTNFTAVSLVVSREGAGIIMFSRS